MEALYRKVEELIESYPKTQCSALDVGCGTGYNTEKIRKKTSRILGLDVKNLVKNKYKNSFKFVLGDARKMSFAANSFDLITCWDVIEHIKEDDQLLKEIYRVLKPGGIVFLSTPNRQRLSNLILSIFKKIEYPYFLGTNEDIGDVIHFREYTIVELSMLCQKIGFKIKRSEAVFLGLVGIWGIYRAPRIFQKICQHIFLTLTK